MLRPLGPAGSHKICDAAVVVDTDFFRDVGRGDVARDGFL
jgi:hypothetical protein